MTGVQTCALPIYDTGADGLVPIRSLGDEFFHHDREASTLMGSNSGRVIQPGQRVTVKLAEAAPVTGGLMLELLTLEGEEVPQGRGAQGFRGRRAGGGRPFGGGRPSGGGPKRKLASAKKKGDKVKRKVKRQGR